MMATLEDNLCAYGKPWPLSVDGAVVGFVVADESGLADVPEGCVGYTAAEVARLAELPTEALHKIHALKARMGGKVRAA